MTYKVTGVLLILLGLSMILYFNLVSSSIPLTSAGLSLMVLGSVSLSLNRIVPENSMRNYLIFLAGILIIINFGLWITGLKELALYFTADAISFILITLFFKFDSKAMAALRPISLTLFIIFLAAIVMKVTQLL
jgi:hypothetical protein